jgi:hypothetical protein
MVLIQAVHSPSVQTVQSQTEESYMRFYVLFIVWSVMMFGVWYQHKLFVEKQSQNYTKQVKF